MTRAELAEQIKAKGSFLCVGLDTDLDKIPQHLLASEDPQFEFNKQIIEATRDYCVAYKPNTAFYEAQGVKGWQSLERTAAYLRENCPDHFSIADAKRGDIGNTSAMYAKAFLSQMDFDSVTVAPYMGKDSVSPFFTQEGKWVILLALTSNPGAYDFQTVLTGDKKLYEEVIRLSSDWGTADNTMYVVGATKAEMLTSIRNLIPKHFLLVPGVGAQGGSLEEVAKFGMNAQCGLLVNASRSILYASSGTDFADKAQDEARSMQEEMARLLKKYRF